MLRSIFNYSLIIINNFINKNMSRFSVTPLPNAEVHYLTFS